MAQKITQEEFEKRVSALSPTLDLSEFRYVNSLTKGHCKCKVCGHEWDVVAGSLLHGVGCRKCFDKKNSDSRKISLEDIQKKLDESHSNITIIGDYIDTKHTALVKCNICGNEWRPIVRYILEGQGCHECAKKRREKYQTKEEFLHKCNEIYHGEYQYINLPDIIGDKDYIDFLCPKHGLIHELVKKHLLGQGCILCRHHGLENIVKDVLRKRGCEFIEDSYIDNTTHLTNYFLPKYNIAINIIGEVYFDKSDKYGGEKWNKIRFQQIERIEDEYRKIGITSVYIVQKRGELPIDFPYVYTRGELRKWLDDKIPKENKNDIHKIKLAKRKYKTDEERNSSLHKRFAKTTEMFINEARKIHGDKYIYDKVNYIKNTEKVCIVCPKHGDFWQSPKVHLKGAGCPICRNEDNRVRLTKSNDKFKEDFLNVWDDTYDISEMNYENSKKKVKVICHKKDKNGQEHGAFMGIPSNLLNGSGCPKCGLESQSKKRTYTFDVFKKKANEIHQNKYQYNETTYTNTEEKTKIRCPEHGDFWMTPHSHLAGQGCPICGRISRGAKLSLTNEDFIKRAREIHGDFYDYSNTKYERITTPVTIICPKHGAFEQQPSVHLNGSGCPKCNESRLERAVRKELETNKIEYKPQARFEWLGMQSLDFYLPNFNIGIECQGAPHFMPEYYNKKKQDPTYSRYKKVIQRDEKKQKLCEENGLDLIYYFDNHFNDKFIFKNKYFNTIEDLMTYITKQEKEQKLAESNKIDISEVGDVEYTEVDKEE